VRHAIAIARRAVPWCGAPFSPRIWSEFESLSLSEGSRIGNSWRLVSGESESFGRGISGSERNGHGSSRTPRHVSRNGEVGRTGMEREIATEKGRNQERLEATLSAFGVNAWVGIVRNSVFELPEKNTRRTRAESVKREFSPWIQALREVWPTRCDCHPAASSNPSRCPRRTLFELSLSLNLLTGGSKIL
jgi:hypothetical protein